MAAGARATRTVLIVDDSQTQLDSLRALLEYEGYRVVSATSGERLLTLLDAGECCDLLISDVVMPGMSGYDLCRAVKQRPRCAHLPVLLITASRERSELVACLRCGADAFMTKPYNPQVLLQRVAYLLRTPAEVQQLVAAEGDEWREAPAPLLNLLTTTIEDLSETNRELDEHRNQLARAKRDLERHTATVERELGLTRQQLQTRDQAIETLDQALLIVEQRDGRYLIVDANEAFAELSGYAADEMIGQEIPRAERWQGALVLSAAMLRALASAGRYRAVLPFDHRQGARHWCQVAIRRMQARDSYGGGRYALLLTEYTAAHQVQRSMEVLAGEARDAGFLARVMTALCDILDAKAAFVLQFRGGSSGRVLAQAGAAGLSVGQELRLQQTPLVEALAEGFWLQAEAVGEQYPGLPRLGDNAPEALAAQRMSDTGGRVMGLVCVLRSSPLPAFFACREVLGLFALAVGAELLRERSQRRYRALFESAPDAMLMTSLSGVIRLANRRAVTLFGYPAHELQGRSLEQLVARPSGLRRAAAGEGGALLTLAADGATVIEARHRDGSVFPAEFSFNPLNGDTEGQVAVAVRDIRERLAQIEDRKRREVAERANEAKSSFLAVMSHEIRTPINGILGSADLLARQNLGGSALELVDSIRESGDGLLAVINDILDFSKIEAGKLILEKEPFSIQATLEAACRSLAAVALRRAVRLTLYTDPQLPDWVLGDGLRLRQILNNLLSNGIKFSSAKGRQGQVHARALRGAGEEVILSVRDNGVGMSEEFARRLFEPFTQEQASTTRRYGGTGLGLSICKQLVELYGGRITVDSAPGNGTRVSVTLPLPEDRRGSPPPPLARLEGCSCWLLCAETERALEWQAYLEHAAAEVRVLAAGEALPGGTQRAVLISDLESSAVAATLQQAAAGLLWIRQGRRRTPRADAAGHISIDMDVMTRASFLQAVAIAAGREALPEREPVRVAPAIVPDARLPSREEAVAAHSLVLVAEDNEVNQRVVRRQLALLGVACSVVDNGRDALQQWRSGDYSLLLTDVHMPEMDGFELVRAIRQQERGLSRFPVVALTANALRGERDSCLAVGMDDYVTKPASLETLRGVLARWLPGYNAAEPAAAAPSPPAGTMPTAAGEAVLDTDVLLQLVADDASMAEDLLQDFAQILDGDGRQLQQLLRGGELSRARKLAHRLKSSSASVGALALAGLCRRIETAVDIDGEQSAVQLSEAISALQGALARRRQAL